MLLPGCQQPAREDRQDSLNSRERCPAEWPPLSIYASSGCCSSPQPSIHIHLPILDHLEPTWKSLSRQVTLSHQQVGNHNPRYKTWNLLLLWLRFIFWPHCYSAPSQCPAQHSPPLLGNWQWQPTRTRTTWDHEIEQGRVWFKAPLILGRKGESMNRSNEAILEVII